MAPVYSLPPEIKALMTTSIVWERFLAMDGYGQPSYASPVSLTCWIEPHGTSVASGETVYRTREGTVVDPDIDIYLDGDDTNARLVRLWDRFTPGGVANEGRSLQALAVEQLLGPNFDNTHPWLIMVTT